MLLAAVLLMVNSFVPAGTEYDAVGALGYSEGIYNGNEWHCAATLVAPDRALTAKHCLDFLGDFVVRFRRNLDGTVGSIELGPASYHNVAVVGVYIPTYGYAALLYLDDPVLHIEPVGVSMSPRAPMDVTIGGWGREGPAIGEGPKRELRMCETAITSTGLVNSFFPSAWAAYGPGCGPNSNDSGGPLIDESARGGRRIVAVVLGSSSAAPLDVYAADPVFGALP